MKLHNFRIGEEVKSNSTLGMSIKPGSIVKITSISEDGVFLRFFNRNSGYRYTCFEKIETKKYGIVRFLENKTC